MSQHVYFEDANGNGDFYQCIIPTNPGESPATTPGKWSRLQIPKQWRDVLVFLTYAELLEMDGQTDKAMEMRQMAEEMDHTGLQVLMNNEAQRDTWRTRPRVQVPLDPLSRANIFAALDRVDTYVQT